MSQPEHRVLMTFCFVLSQINELRTKVFELNDDLVAERIDNQTLRAQATSRNAEFDRLTGEYSKLEKRVLASSKAD